MYSFILPGKLLSVELVCSSFFDKTATYQLYFFSNLGDTSHM